MKYKLLCLFAFLVLLGTSCKKASLAPPLPIPSGVFSGQFLFVHRKLTVLPYDTIKANVTVTMQTTPGNAFSVTGDTTQHAGSHGSFIVSSNLIYFNDITYPQDGSIPRKIHLSGTYDYYYDGSTFQLLGASTDTAAYEYNLKKTN